MDETSSDRRAKETKILSTFLQKAQESKKSHSALNQPERTFEEVPQQGPASEKPSDSDPISDEYPHLSPEAAQLIRKMTDSTKRRPIRSLCKNWEIEEPALSEPAPDAVQADIKADIKTNSSIMESEDQEILFPGNPAGQPVSKEEPISPMPSAISPETDHWPKEASSVEKSDSAVKPNLLLQWKTLADFDYSPDHSLSEPAPLNKEPAVKKGEIVVVSNLHKGYVKGKMRIPVLRGVDFSVRQGEYLSIVGQSGSGKSTLLHLIGTLDIPDSGMVHFDGQRIDNLPNRQRDLLRNRYIGMIFQFYHLIPEMTMIENVLAPLMIREGFFSYLSHRRQYRARAKELLEMVGLGHRIRHKPNELSGGEMQRTAIARALITEPRILLADEPTGNLDSRTSNEIVKLLRSLNQEQKLTIIMVTHDTAQAEDADRYIRLVDGQIAETVQKR